MKDRDAGQGQRFDGGSIARRLLARQPEIERAFTRSRAFPGSDTPEGEGANRRNAVAELVGYAIRCIARGEEESTPIPSAAIAFARAAAWEGATLDTVLVPLIAAYALFNEFVLDETNQISNQDMRRVQSLQGSMLVRLARLLAEEYKDELGRRATSAQRRRVALVEQLLAGVPVDRRELPYAFDGWHIALVVTGPRAADAARIQAESLGARHPTVAGGNETVWAWIGSRQRISVERLRRALEQQPIPKARFAVGEPGEGVEGWRSSHFEARAAHAVAIRMPGEVTYFSAVALEAIALQTPDLAQSLQTTYLAPLARRGRGGATLRQTLRAYFAAGRNASSAASALRVTRRTVENRLRTVESELGRSLNMCGAELEMALRLERLKETDTKPG